MTAFIIESLKGHEPGPAQESVELLRQIVSQSADTAQSELTSNHTIATCNNIFWLLSLVLSVTATFIGIVSLHWIRTCMRILSNGPVSLGLNHMHFLGLYIPLVITILSVILVFSLSLFLVGLLVFIFKLSWLVATPVTIATGFTFTFLLATTAHPGLQLFPIAQQSSEPDLFPSPYRSPQSLLFFRLVNYMKRLWPNHHYAQAQDWTSWSRIWLRQREKAFAVEEKQQSHLEYKPEETKAKKFAYDTIKALVEMKETGLAENKEEKMALAKCLAEVLPNHLDLFPTGDLADLIPFLPRSKFVPSVVFLRENLATREDLSAIALVQIATCMGRPSLSSTIVEASVHVTRWLFDHPRTFDSVPDKQPLHIVSQLGMSPFVALLPFYDIYESRPSLAVRL